MSGEPWQPTAALAASEIDDDLAPSRGIVSGLLISVALICTLIAVAAAIAL